jgi:hypothetical protein
MRVCIIAMLKQMAQLAHTRVGAMEHRAGNRRTL